VICTDGVDVGLFVMKMVYLELSFIGEVLDHLCGLVVRVVGYRYGGPGSIPGTTRKKSSASETGSTQPREYN
jgi:hypothetical protein